MSDLREAAQQALEALKDHKRSDAYRVSIAMHVLSTALEREQAEPVAWMCPDDPEPETAFSWEAGHCDNCGKQRIPLYTAPPQRKPLTDDRLWELWNIDSDDAYKNCPTYFQGFRYVARIVEWAHGIEEEE